jgi:hypothetical protein
VSTSTRSHEKVAKAITQVATSQKSEEVPAVARRKFHGRSDACKEAHRHAPDAHLGHLRPQLFVPLGMKMTRNLRASAGPAVEVFASGDMIFMSIFAAASGQVLH